MHQKFQFSYAVMNSNGSNVFCSLFVTEVQNNEKDRKLEEEEQVVIHEDERTSKKSKHV